MLKNFAKTQFLKQNSYIKPLQIKNYALVYPKIRGEERTKPEHAIPLKKVINKTIGYGQKHLISGKDVFRDYNLPFTPLEVPDNYPWVYNEIMDGVHFYEAEPAIFIKKPFPEDPKREFFVIDLLNHRDKTTQHIHDILKFIAMKVYNGFLSKDSLLAYAKQYGDPIVQQLIEQRSQPFLHDIPSFAELVKQCAAHYKVNVETVEQNYWLGHYLSLAQGASIVTKGRVALNAISPEKFPVVASEIDFCLFAMEEATSRSVNQERLISWKDFLSIDYDDVDVQLRGTSRGNKNAQSHIYYASALPRTDPMDTLPFFVHMDGTILEASRNELTIEEKSFLPLLHRYLEAKDLPDRARVLANYPTKLKVLHPGLILLDKLATIQKNYLIRDTLIGLESEIAQQYLDAALIIRNLSDESKLADSAFCLSLYEQAKKADLLPTYSISHKHPAFTKLSKSDITSLDKSLRHVAKSFANPSAVISFQSCLDTITQWLSKQTWDQTVSNKFADSQEEYEKEVIAKYYNIADAPGLTEYTPAGTPEFEIPDFHISIPFDSKFADED